MVQNNGLKSSTTLAETSSEVTCNPTDTEKHEVSLESHHQNTNDDLIAIIPADSGESTPQFGSS